MKYLVTTLLSNQPIVSSFSSKESQKQITFMGALMRLLQALSFLLGCYRFVPDDASGHIARTIGSWWGL